MKKYTQDQLMDALNYIDELADIGAVEHAEKYKLQKSYELVASFIETHADKK